MKYRHLIGKGRPSASGSLPPSVRRPANTAPGHRWVVGTLLVAVGLPVAVIAIAVAAPGDAVVLVRAGELRSYAGPVEELRVFGRLTLFLDPEYREPRASADLLSVLLLTALAGVAASGFLIARTLGERVHKRIPGLLVVVTLGATWLALDELVGLHETIGANVPFSLPGVDHNDDAIVALYAVAGVAFVVRSRGALRSSRRALSLILGLALTIVAAGVDMITPSGAEELVEVAAAAALLIGFTLLVLDALRQGFSDPRRTVPASPTRPSDAFA